MTWLIVVGVVVAAALVIHLWEQRTSRAVITARRAERLREGAGLRYFKCTLEVREEWHADFETMTLEIERKGAVVLGDAALAYRLERSPEGVWQVGVGAPTSSGTATATGASGQRALPSPIAEQLEAQYQRFLSRLAKQQPGK